MALKEVWPGYETVERIGKGGYGTVYKVRKTDPTGEYYSAVKKISIPKDEDEYYALKEEDYSEENITEIFEQRMQRIVDEFKLMAKFKGQSHIVSYEDHMIVEHENGIGWDILIRMELLTNLKRHFKNMDENDVIRLGIDMCKALEIIQRENIVHRDIKPENILVNEYGQYKLSDFGIAKTMDHVTKATLIGTPDYIAPEVFKKQAYGFLADEYSLGLVLYWALNERRMPFVEIKDKPPTDEENQNAQKRRMDGEGLPEPLHGNPLLKKAVLKACAYNPADRYQTITEFKRALQLCESGFSFTEDDTPTEEIEAEENITSSETMGAWGHTSVKDEEPVSPVEPEETENKYHRILEKLRKAQAKGTDARAIISTEKKIMQEVSAYDSFLVGLAYTFGSEVIVTERYYKDSIEYNGQKGWRITFHEKGKEEYFLLIRNEEVGRVWLEHAAENGEYRAMALLSYIYEYDKNDLQNAQNWMNKAYYLPSSEYKDFFKQETERQNKKANTVVVDKTEILRRFAGGMNAQHFSIKPNIDPKWLQFAYRIMRSNGSYKYYGGEEDLNTQEIIGVYVSKESLTMRYLLVIFTEKKIFSHWLYSLTTQTKTSKNMLGEKMTSTRQILFSYCTEYKIMQSFEITDFMMSKKKCKAVHMMYTPDANYKEGYLAYNPKVLDGNVLMNLLKALADTEKKDALNTNLRTQIFLQKTKDLKVSEQVITDVFRNVNDNFEDIFGDLFNKK